MGKENNILIKTVFFLIKEKKKREKKKLGFIYLFSYTHN